MKYLSTGEVAERLGVTPSTVKRWVDSGLVRGNRTAGGHRRVLEAEVERLRAELAADRPAALSWVQLLESPDAFRLQSELLRLRAAAGSWWRVAQDVCRGLEEIGEMWASGECRVAEEHLFSEALRRSAAACAAALPRAGAAPAALLMTVHGERHTLGLALAELALAEAGWEVVLVGEGPPGHELGWLFGAREPDLVILSASVASSRDDLAAYLAAVAAALRGHRTTVALVGRGPWSAGDGALRLTRWDELPPLLERLARAPAAARATSPAASAPGAGQAAGIGP